MDAQSEAYMRQALDNDQGAVLDVAVAVMDHIVGDDSGADFTAPGHVLQAFAEANRITPQEAQARIRHLGLGYQADAARMAEKSTGIPADVAADALYQSRNAPGLKDLMMQHLHEGRADSNANSASTSGKASSNSRI